MSTGNIALLLGYEHVYGIESPKESLDYIKSIPRNILVFIFSDLNIMIKEPLEFEYKKNRDQQRTLIYHFSNNKPQVAAPYLKAYDNLHAKINNKDPQGKNILLFCHRALCLFALQEIMTLPDKVDWTFTITNTDIENLLKYIACINDKITSLEGIALSNRTPLETFLSEGLVLNELDIVINPIFIWNWYIELIKYFQSHEILSDYIKQYFDALGFSPNRYLLSISESFSNKYIDNKGKNIVNRDTSKNNKMENVYNHLSKRNLITPSHLLDLVEIKKSPIFKIATNRYIISDYMLLNDKLYESFIADFYFDFLKVNNIKFDNYKEYIGNYFEQYCCKLLNRMFSSYTKQIFEYGPNVTIVKRAIKKNHFVISILEKIIK